MKYVLSLLLLFFPLAAYAALDDNITAYWKFDENTGTSLNDEVGTADGTFNGTTGSQWTSGCGINSGLNFVETSSNWVSLASNPLSSNPTAFSVQAWIYLTSDENASIVDSRAYEGAPAHVSGFTLSYCSDGFGIGANTKSINVTIGTNSDNSIFTTPANSISLNTCYHIVLTHSDGTTPKVYINGTSQTMTHTDIGQGGTTPTINWGSSHEPGIGQDSQAYNAGLYWEGKIDEPAIWTRAITGAEVTSLYNSGTGLQYPFSSAAPTSILGLVRTFWIF